MSTRKIIRLSSASKQKERSRTPESTFANTNFLDFESAVETKNGECSETLRVTLVNQINKIYRQTQNIRKDLEKQQQINEEILHERKILKAQVRILQKECENYKEMYQVQCGNHQRLREFYQKREKQWQVIVYSHKRMLEQYDQRHGSFLHKNQNEEKGQIGLASKEKIDQDYQTLQEIQEQRKMVKNETPKREIKRLKRKAQSESKKEILNQESPKVAYYYAEINRLYSEQKQFESKSQLYNQKDCQHHAKKPLNRNPEADDFFERILRTTYYYFRARSLSINQIKQCEDMIKLRHAKTSTKQRLLKTVKKLEFQVKSENQLQSFCDYIEQIVLHQQKMFRGDLVCNFILEKLQECEELAQKSNSEIERFDQSLVKPNQYDADVEKVSRDNLELLLNSTIKKPPPAISSLSSKVRYSISSLQNLSDLIHGDTQGGN